MCYYLYINHFLMTCRRDLGHAVDIFINLYHNALIVLVNFNIIVYVVVDYGWNMLVYLLDDS